MVTCPACNEPIHIEYGTTKVSPFRVYRWRGVRCKRGCTAIGPKFMTGDNTRAKAKVYGFRRNGEKYS